MPVGLWNVLVPERVMLPLAKGEPADGRTWMFEINNVFGTAPEPPLAEEMVNVMAEVVTLVAAKLLPVAVELMFFDEPPPAVTNADTVAEALVLNTNPLGAVKMIVPVPISPTADSSSVGPLNFV